MLLLIVGSATGQQAWGADGVDRCAVRFVDRGRHLGLSYEGDAVREQADVVLLWMLAAARVDPDYADALFWQYDLANRLRRTDAAKVALNRYVTLQPDNALAMLRWLEFSLADRQTVESRIAFCGEQLERSPLPEVVADLRLKLARFHTGRGDQDKALEHAELAAAAVPHEAAALHMVMELRGDLRTDAGRIRLLLADIRANPADVQRIWRLGRQLARLSMHAEARVWFDHAVRLWPVVGDRPEPPLSWTLEAARSAFDGGLYEAVVDRLGILVEQSSSPMVSVLHVQALEKLGRTEEASAVRDQLKRYLSDNESALLAGENPLYAAEAAWFYLTAEPNVQQAGRFAEAAYTHGKQLRLARRVHGLAAAIAGDHETAKRVLPRMVSSDQWAAEALAAIYAQEGRVEDALASLRRAESLNFAGEAHARIVKRLTELGEKPLAKPEHSDVSALLGAFDETIVSFAAKPSEFLDLAVSCGDQPRAYGEPIACSLTLANTGAFAVTLGDGGMVSPTVLVSARLEHGAGMPDVARERYASIALDRRLTLMPGEKLTVHRTVDVGDGRALSRSRPALDVTLTFSFLLDPSIQLDGSWTSRLHRFQPVHAIVERKALSSSQLTPPAPSDGHERWSDWIEVVEAGSEQPATVNAMAAGLGSEDWAIRLMVVDTLAKRQGKVFAPVLKQLASDDPDALVRRLAKLHLTRLASSRGNALSR